MAELAEIVRENVGKSSYRMREFFQDIIEKGELIAYNVEVNKKIVEKDTEDEKIVKIIKGATLIPTKELKEYQSVLVEDTKTKSMYNLDIGSRGGMFFNEGDSQTMYHHCILEKLAKKFDPKKVVTRKGFGDFGSFDDGISISEKMVTARLRVSYDEDWESGGGYDYLAGIKGDLVVEGELDELFEKVYKFVRVKYPKDN